MSSLRVEGLVDCPLILEFKDLKRFALQIEEVASVVPGKPGSGVALKAILAAAKVQQEATHVYLESLDASFQASLPLEAVSEAVLAYSLNGEPLPSKQGGPVRFLTPHKGGCDKEDGHACANVKGLSLIRMTQE